MAESHIIGWVVSFPPEAWCTACMPGYETLQARLEARGFRHSAINTIRADATTTARCWHCDETLTAADLAGQRALENAIEQLLDD